jgi:WD40 repeat protein
MSILMKFSGYKQTKYLIKPAFAGDLNTFVCTGSEDSNIYIWDVENVNIKQQITGHSGIVNSLSWSNCNGGMLISASDDHTIRIWKF